MGFELYSYQDDNEKALPTFQAEDAARREKNLEEAKKIVIEQDTSLPEAKQVRLLQ